MIAIKIAVLTDAHANFPALWAALAAIRRAGCDAIYHTGDGIGIGPYPAECLELLLTTPRLRLLMGNHDAWFACGLPTPRPAWLGEGELAHHRWTHAQLAPTLRPTVVRWPYIVREEIGGVAVAFAHYGLDRSGRDFAPAIADPDGAALDRLFAGETARLVFYGHHHPASDIRGRARYVNPGALGCAPAPLARFVILELDGRGGFALRKCAVPYADAALFRAFEERRVPERATIRRIFFGRDG